jgi:hypothetical protein
LSIVGCLIRWRCKILISQSSAATFDPNDFLAILEYFHFLQSGFFVEANGAQWHFQYHIISVLSGAVILISSLSVLCVYVLVVAHVQEGPEIAVASQNDVTAPAPVAPIGACHWVEFGAHEMSASCASMSAAAEDADLIDEI